MPTYLPETQRLQPTLVPEDGWSSYSATRPLVPQLNATTLAIISKRLSQALTVMLALQKFYTIEDLGRMTDINVHVIGAGLYEVPADAVWEELFHLLPSLRKLHVAFIGPEVGDIIKEEDNMTEFDMAVCPGCKRFEKRRIYSYGMFPYHVYLDKVKQATPLQAAPPTIVAAFNSGIQATPLQAAPPTIVAAFKSGM
eukprot:gene22276-29351_t